MSGGGASVARWVAYAVMAAGAFGMTVGALAQGPPPPTYIPQTKFTSGQNVVPVFEGWLRNPDGTFTMVFGYFNRNLKEEFAIPPGPENKIEPGEVDRGQPTYFLPRRQAWVFRVQVPKDWGQKELVWTLTAHGRTEKAYAQLLPVEEITERIIMTRGNLNPGDDDPNKPPSVSVAPVGGARVDTPVTLTALVSDDGLPKPRPPAKPRPGAQSNNVDTARPRGLTVSWMQYRGPAKVIFDSAGPTAVADGKAATTAHFTEPGAYVLRAIANDGQLSTRADVTITVK
jgi:hypothetical protein